MFVKSIMIPKEKCVYGNKDASLKEILMTLDSNRIEGMPIVDEGQYIGIITKPSIYEHFFNSTLGREDFLEQTKAFQIAFQGDFYLTGEEIFEYTLLELKEIPLVAVVDEQNNFQGIVTRFDVLEQFQSAFGMKRKGLRIAFTSIETEGRIATFSQIADKFDEDIISLVTFDETDHLVRRIVLKVAKSKNSNRFIKELEDSGFRIIDIREF